PHHVAASRVLERANSSHDVELDLLAERFDREFLEPHHFSDLADPWNSHRLRVAPADCDEVAFAPDRIVERGEVVVVDLELELVRLVLDVLVLHRNDAIAHVDTNLGRALRLHGDLDGWRVATHRRLSVRRVSLKISSVT